jgi:hypothetical protein
MIFLKTDIFNDDWQKSLLQVTARTLFFATTPVNMFKSSLVLLMKSKHIPLPQSSWKIVSQTIGSNYQPQALNSTVHRDQVPERSYIRWSVYCSEMRSNLVRDVMPFLSRTSIHKSPTHGPLKVSIGIMIKNKYYEELRLASQKE